ncbi:metal-binding protein [Pedobacter petrophilus]|uniref:Metal-binding protein n=1 Tax=Pedobacter petrophilus TaxID=1908241 RepID=A0A7K0FW09_9SPHI|nr:Ada metal-binding domain-containing protein [Pedobacter petrophilus]MRX75542.1 metal-binding protein [Pedobacter petrophilus]
MINHHELSAANLAGKIKNKEICFGGNIKLKIYGSLQCKSGKSMKRENRVFFKSEQDAIDAGFRPCAHCLFTTYKKWICSVQQ